MMRIWTLLIAVLLFLFPMQGTSYSNWWDDMGEPEYGGMLRLFLTGIEFSADPERAPGSNRAMWLEPLFAPDLTVNPDIYAFNSAFVPEEYATGLLAESWEWTDPQTITVRLKKGIHWQNKPPVNGREFQAEDVVYSFDRLMGTGSGFTKPNPFWRGALSSIKNVIAIDDYTVQFKLKKPGATAIYQILEGKIFIVFPIVAREWVDQGDTQNWQNAVGTGPWMLTEYISNTSLTYSRYPNYWGIDERHPGNQLPYLDAIKYIVIPDTATALAAFRSGKIDMMPWDRAGALTLQQAETLAKTNPEIIQSSLPGGGFSLEMRVDLAPFTDIRVRKALNMALDRKLIAQNYYNGHVDGIPSSVVAPHLKDWAFNYNEWPKDLKDGYGYHPEMARKLLAEAATDGIFERNKRGGFDTNCVTAGGPDIEILEIIKSMFLDIGVDMEIKVMDGVSLRAFTMDKKHDAMASSARMSMPFHPIEAVQVRVSSHRACLNFHNDKVYADMVASIDEASTMDEAKVRVKAADRYNLEQYWSVYVCPTIIPIAWQPWVKGYNCEHLNTGLDGYVPARMWIHKD